MPDVHQLTHLQLPESILILGRNNCIDCPIYALGFGVKNGISRESKQEGRRAVIVLQYQGVWED
jgi:hypothetical protein